MSKKYDADRIRRCLHPIRLDRMHRLIRKSSRRRAFHARPRPSRFSDTAERFAVLYGAENVECGFWEAIARNRFDRARHRKLPRQDIESTLVVSFRSTETLLLVDLRGDGPARLSAPTAVVHDSNHVAGRALSAATYANVPEADGFLFPSRFTGDTCVAVFDRAIPKLEILEITSLIEYEGLSDMLDKYEIRLVC